MIGPRLSAAALIAGLTLTSLTACSDNEADDDKHAPSSSAASESPSASSSILTPAPSASATEVDFGKRARGPKVTGTGYTFNAPKGWVEDSDGARKLDASVDTAAWEKQVKDGFRDNVAVTMTTAAGGTIDGLEESMTGQLTEQAKRLKTHKRLMIDGRVATHHSAVMTAQPVPYALEQFATITDEGEITVIAFSYPADLSAKKRTATTNSVLASWRWSE